MHPSVPGMAIATLIASKVAHGSVFVEESAHACARQNSERKGSLTNDCPFGG